MYVLRSIFINPQASTSSSTLSLPLLSDEPSADLPMIVVPPSLSLPISSKELRNMICEASQNPTSSAVDEEVYTPKSVKSVNLTTDDILVHPFFGSYTCDNINRIMSINERVPVDFIPPAYVQASTTEYPISHQHVHSHTTSKTIDNFQQQFSSCTSHFSQSDTCPNDFSVLPDMNTVFFSASDSRQSDKPSSKPSPEQMLNAREKCEQLVRLPFIYFLKRMYFLQKTL